MSEFIGSIWWLLVALGVLVTFHEFGHYWVARRCGVKVLRFSVGFGKPLWSRRDRHGTEFCIAAIPLGGYVKMLDENALDEGDAPIPANQLDQAFNRKSVWRRIAIVAAGPIANLVLCVALLWAMFVVGKQDYSATIGHVQGMAAQAGLQRGERILRIGEREVATWADAATALTIAAIDGQDARIEAESADGDVSMHTLRLSALPAGFDQENVMGLAGIGWQFQVPPAVVGKVAPGTPAAASLQAGDQITAIDGSPVRDLAELQARVAELGQRGGEAMVEVDREGQRLAFPIAPQRMTTPAGVAYWGLGIEAKAMEPAYDALRRLGPLAAIPAAFRETWKIASDSLGMLRRMLFGQASSKNVSGVITIARAANFSAGEGLATFLWFLGAVSLSLAIINLLPIPVLDGGHLLYYLIELVKGSPLSERAMAAGQYAGLAALAGLMGLALYNDILRLPFR